MRVYEREREGKGKETEKPQSVGGDGVLRGGERGKDQRTPGKKKEKKEVTTAQETERRSSRGVESETVESEGKDRGYD